MTVEQLTIDAAPTVTVDPPRLTPDEQWRRACRLNPGLDQAFADTARQLHAAGVRATANRVAEEMRDRHRTVGDTYTFNNTWRSPAAAWMRATHPDLAVHMTYRKAGGGRG